jgi:hypothetical protein
VAGHRTLKVAVSLRFASPRRLAAMTDSNKHGQPLPPRPRSASRPGSDSAITTIVVDRPAVLAYQCGNLFMMVWRGATTDEALDAVHASMTAMVAIHPEGIGIVSIIERGAPPPSTEHRARVREVQERMASRLRCLVVLVEGMGFWASAVLGAATAIVSARRTRFPQKVCRAREEAIQFIAEKMQGTLSADPRALARALEYVRSDVTMRGSR